MPGEMDGLELARITRLRWPEIDVILTSGFPGSQVGQTQTGAGGERLLGKPYRKDELARALREAIDRSRD